MLKLVVVVSGVEGIRRLPARLHPTGSEWLERNHVRGSRYAETEKEGGGEGGKSSTHPLTHSLTKLALPSSKPLPQRTPVPEPQLSLLDMLQAKKPKKL